MKYRLTYRICRNNKIPKNIPLEATPLPSGTLQWWNEDVEFDNILTRMKEIEEEHWEATLQGRYLPYDAVPWVIFMPIIKLTPTIII